MMAALKKERVLPDSTNMKQLLSCVYGRLNTHLYEYRPKVSLLMQYFRKPEMIHGFIEQMKKCNVRQGTSHSISRIA